MGTEDEQTDPPWINVPFLSSYKFATLQVLCHKSNSIIRNGYLFLSIDVSCNFIGEWNLEMDMDKNLIREIDRLGFVILDEEYERFFNFNQ